MRNTRFALYIGILLALLMISPALAEPEDTGFDVCYADFMESADASGKPEILYTAKTVLSLNMRSEPGTHSRVVTQLEDGRRLIVSGEADANGWVPVRTAEYTGFVKLEYLTRE